MADKTSKTDKKKDKGATAKSSDTKIFIGVGILFLFLAIAYGMSLGPIEIPEAPKANIEESEIDEIEQAYSEDGMAIDDAEEVVADDIEVEVSENLETSSPAFDLAAAKKERVLGDPSAPIKITEHSSLTCGHCGKFHTETFKELKAAYLDTGEAYLVFSDFPLNAPALHATMAARCIADNQKYFEFIGELFETQKDWAGENNYLSLLESKAEAYGIDKATFAACVQNQELQDSILKRMQAVQKQWEISSTPSFVIDNQVVLSGARPYDDFDKAIKDAVTEIHGENSPEPANEGE